MAEFGQCLKSEMQRCQPTLARPVQGRYLFLNSLANQLRYPNSHTHWFSCILLSLFAEAKQVRALLRSVVCQVFVKIRKHCNCRARSLS